MLPCSFCLSTAYGDCSNCSNPVCSGISSSVPNTLEGEIESASHRLTYILVNEVFYLYFLFAMATCALCSNFGLQLVLILVIWTQIYVLILGPSSHPPQSTRSMARRAKAVLISCCKTLENVPRVYMLGAIVILCSYVCCVVVGLRYSLPFIRQDIAWWKFALIRWALPLNKIAIAHRLTT